MMFYKYYLVFFLFLSSCSNPRINGSNSNELLATELKPFGRTCINENQELELISSAVHFGFSFEGTECKVFASIPNTNGHNYLQYEMDGVYRGRIRIDGDSNQPIILKAKEEGRHVVWIYKVTEAHSGPVFIEKIQAKNIKSLQREDMPLIEFIGNSITCGAAADPSEIPCGTGEYHDQHNAFYAYGPRIARELNTNFLLSSVSGAGVYRNWNSDGPALPLLYKQTDFSENKNRLWTFENYVPDIISIALGTNDLSNGDGIKQRLPFDSSKFVNNYILFIQQVKSKYPIAQIALLSSPMMNGERRILLQNCLSVVKQKIDLKFPTHKPVALHFFQPMQARGCSGHPSVEDHAVLGTELKPFFEKLLAHGK